MAEQPNELRLQPLYPPAVWSTNRSNVTVITWVRSFAPLPLHADYNARPPRWDGRPSNLKGLLK